MGIAIEEERRREITYINIIKKLDVPFSNYKCWLP
jgi:hypothetical protein